ncbi:MAG: hypothetical protein ACM3UU_00080 [Ignavibacteriales bacterium]
MVERVYDREKLYKEVWTEPMVKVAERYNVSDVALKKMCKKLNVPVPGRGYWAKIYAGAEMSIPKLPKHKGKDKIVVRDYSEKPTNTSSDSIKKEKFHFLSEEKRQEVNKLCASITIPDKLERPHPLIRDTIQYYKSRKESTKPSASGVLKLNITDNMEDRVYRFLDTLFKSLEKLGYTIGIYAPKADRYYNYTPCVWDNVMYVGLGQDKADIIIKEKQTMIPHVLTEKELEEEKKYGYSFAPKSEFVYTGKLWFIIDEYVAKRKNWHDSEKKMLENEIGNIIIAIIDTINDAKIRREEREIEEARRREEQEKRRIYEQKCQQERQKINVLISNSNDYYKAKKIYEYISALKEELKNIDDRSLVEKSIEYIEWAKQKADWLNPLIAREDDLLGRRYQTIDEVEEEKDDIY